MQLNIESDRFWCDGLVRSSGIQLRDCAVKESADDFHVFEIPYGDDGVAAGPPIDLSSVMIHDCQHGAGEFRLRPRDCRFAVTTPSAAGLDTQDNDTTATAAPFDVAEFLDPYADTLGRLNDWVLAAVPSEVRTSEVIPPAVNGPEEFILPMPASKDSRRAVYELIEERYPYLKVSIDGNKKINNGGTADSDDRKAGVGPATQLLDLNRAGLAWSDCLAVQRFLCRGPIHPSANGGLGVGAGLDKPQRTAVYKLLTRAYHKLDSKTVDTAAGGKELRLYWRRNAVQQASHMQRGRGVGGTAPTNSQAKISTAVVDWDRLRQILETSLTSESTEDIAEETVDERLENQVNPKRRRIDNPSTCDNISTRLVLPRYLSFVLVKYNVEQTDAFASLAGILENLSSKSSSDGSQSSFPRGLVASSYLRAFSSSGVKDRRGLTAQRCCVELLPSWVNASTGDSGSDALCSPAYIESMLRNGECETSLMHPAQQQQVALLAAAARELMVANQLSLSSLRRTSGIMTSNSEVASALVACLVQRGQGVLVGDLRTCHDPLQMGQHWGNRFKVVIRNISVHRTVDTNNGVVHAQCGDDSYRKEIEQTLQRRMDAMGQIGFPNFFGSQRFGYISKHSTLPPPLKEDSVLQNTDSDMETASNTIQPNAEVLECDDAPFVHGSEDDEIDGDGKGGESNGAVYTISINAVPVGPRIGKALILGDWINAVHALVLGDQYEYFDAARGREGKTQDSEGASVATDGKSADTKLSALERARRLYASGARPSEVLRWLPSSMAREKWVLQGLVRHGGNRNLYLVKGVDNTASAPVVRECDDQISHRRAIETVPYGARLIWVHAYQSWLWNAVASHRLFRENSASSAQPGQPCLGDLLDLNLLAPPVRQVLNDHFLKGGNSDRNSSGGFRSVVEIDEYALQVLAASQDKNYYSALTLPLVGTHVQFPSNESGRHYYELLLSEGFELIAGPDPVRPWIGFRMKPSGGVPLKGAYRNVLQSLEGAYSVSVTSPSSSSVSSSTSSGDSPELPRYSAVLEFGLPSGSYATVLLREALRSDEF